jgi:cobalt-zinc-cadmium efflux system outer membrane protein
MKKTFVVWAVFSLTMAGPVKSQQNNPQTIQSGGASSIDHMIQTMLTNNPRLSAVKHFLEAEKMDNLVGLTPSDPVVSVNYLKPNPRIRNQRFDYEISQEFDFPTVYGRKKTVAKYKNAGIDYEFSIARQEMVHEILQTWLSAVYFKKRVEHFDQQWLHADRLAKANQDAFHLGQASVLDRNKAQLFAAQIKKEVDFSMIEVQTAENKLFQLNGGKAIANLPTEYPMDWKVATTFEDWYQLNVLKSGLLMQVQNEVEVSKANEKLAQAKWLPSFQVGFMREQDIEVDFKGVTLGMTIPLWQNKNVTNQARSQRLAAESNLKEEQLMVYLSYQQAFEKAKAWEKQLNEIKTILSDSTNPDLLKKAFDLGEMTLVEYMVELGMYYDLQEKYLEAEFAYFSSLAALATLKY